MIVTVCGAYRNAGDHLIGKRARDLLSKFVDEDIVIVDRKAITQEHIDVFNRAKAVLLTGGPAYQRGMYPTIYPFDYKKVKTPIIPYGLGWKAPIGVSVSDFSFKPEAKEFVSSIHENIKLSSARDPITVDVLEKCGVKNTIMTGCPAWYDMQSFDKQYLFESNIKTLVFSMPAKKQAGVKELIKWLTKEFPKSQRILSFHHGLMPVNNKIGRKRALYNFQISAYALSQGWKVASLASSLNKMESLYKEADLHIGYRVHAHLFCLSQRISSILINEDSRGVGQSRALGSTSLDVNEDGNIQQVISAIENHFDTRGEMVFKNIENMRETFPKMRHFLSTI